MALGYLFILFIFMTVVSLLGVFLLYFLKNKTGKNIIFYGLVIWSMLIAYLNATSLPTNFLVEQFIAWGFGFVSIIAIIIKVKNPEKTTIPYILVTASTLIGLYTLFF
ncbi:hypothetical protein JCM1393_20300 [Clostridium carnis]